MTYGYDDSNNRKLLTSSSIQPIENATGVTNQFDGFNQLKSSVSGGNTVNYTYNADGIRTSKSVNGTITTQVLDGVNVVIDLGTTTTKYVRGINLICSEVGGVRSYYLYNGHGDVVQITDNSGNIVNSYNYDAFGVESNIDPADTNVFRYSGEYFDKETGSIYLRARYYNPVDGRFISEDSYSGKANDPLSLNLYTYCGNNPVNFFDPTGHSGSIVDYLNSNGMSSSFKNRANLAIQYGVVKNTSQYKGTASQNTSLLNAITKLPKKGEPNSTDRLHNPDGSIKQERKYKPNGDPDKDRDYNHGGVGHVFPHDHYWDDDGVRGDPVPVEQPETPSTKSDSTISNVKKAAGWAAVGSAAYWIISEATRVIPFRNLIPLP